MPFDPLSVVGSVVAGNEHGQSPVGTCFRFRHVDFALTGSPTASLRLSISTSCFLGGEKLRWWLMLCVTPKRISPR